MYAAHAASLAHPTAPRAAADDDCHARLNRLAAALAESDRRGRLFRDEREEREMLLMTRPVPVERAYAFFGTLLGALPPAAIFIRVFGNWSETEPGWSYLSLVAICLAMNVVCAVVGRQMGRAMGQPVIANAERRSWTRMLPVTLLAAFVWALATGAAGGAVFFGIGAVFGVAFALMVALPSFLVFTVLHRLLARGGMIDARHLRPLAWGVAATSAALALGL